MLYRSLGRALEAVGVIFQGQRAAVDTLVPSSRVVSLKGKSLQYGLQAFVAPTASVVGDVKMGELASVWYGATVRGDAGAVTIGSNTAVQDCAVVSGTPGSPATIGNNVTIAPGSVVSAATIEDGAMVGMGARVLPGAVVGKNAFVDAGAVVLAGANIPSGELWTGNPAAKLRALSTEEVEYLHHTAEVNASLSQQHYEETSKSVEEMEADLAVKDYREEHFMEPEEPIPQLDADVVQYYKLSADPEDQGLFREKQLSDGEAYERLLASQAEADLEEERFLTEKVQSQAAAEAAAEAGRQRKLNPLP